MSSYKYLKHVILLLCILLASVSLIDLCHYESFLVLAEEGRRIVETNLSEEKLASIGLSDRLTYVCVSGCGIENGTYEVVYLLESKTPFVLTGEKGSLRYVYDR